ncbi:hypothetical protein NK718_00985 [Alsobacter sp. SYSU M60028]|uniref:Sel1 repeat family protein n=1 Tax=Alsobacter ponti TaxID=2962936 RepID=A0ABT1L6S4_9HYPH|nr:hypothetical protein [Alsobacter ponti]MCP8937080.1 hypothetical protein [Alsobacter ponti]
MTFDAFRASLGEAAPPPGLGEALLALWWDGKGDWEKAHTHAQADEARDGSWVHAYLHRKEGDLGNAGYWYARAGRSRPESTLEAEWEIIARELLGRAAG